MCPGKKDHVKNVQKRFLLSPYIDLHLKYCKAYNSRMSLIKFRRLKPYDIIKPKLCHRDTCICLKHSNFEYLVDTLHKNKLTASNKLSDVRKSVCCDTENKSCSKCKSKKAFEPNPDNLDKSVTYFQWTRISETRLIKRQEKKVNFLIKDKSTTLLRVRLSEVGH